MTQNRRIVLNIVATYGRSLYMMVIGLFTARWVLQALGQVDFGLMGLVGGLAMFVMFLNSLLASAVGRFYAVEVGAAIKADKLEGLEKCRRWFNVAFLLHMVVAVVLVLIGYPLGIWTVEHYLEIPVDRIGACIWVWRFTCLSCFVAMVSVPFQAMYTAKQEIAELTIYGFCTTTCNACFFYYMVIHPGVWLTRYAAWVCAISIIPQMIISVRAIFKYEECAFCKGYMIDMIRVKELLKYSSARFWDQFSGMVGAQGQAILVNKFMGPVYNSSMTVGSGVAGHALSFSNALSAAFSPAIANKAGENDEKALHQLSFMTCRIGALLVLIFAVPLCLEIRSVLKLWLVSPPPFAAEICTIVLVRMFFEKLTEGYELAIFGTGNGVMRYCWIQGWAGISTAVVAGFCFWLGLGMWSIVIGLTVSKCITCIVRLAIGKQTVGFTFGDWYRHVFSRISCVSIGVVFVGAVVRVLFEPSFARICVITVSCEIALALLTWFFAFERTERLFLVQKARHIFCRNE